MVFDKAADASIRPRYLIYDIMQFEVSLGYFLYLLVIHSLI